MQDHNTIYDRLNVPEAVRKMLDRAYAQPHRHFHTMEHIDAVISGIDMLSSAYDLHGTDMLNALYWAALLHDVVYDPMSSTNEADSVQVAHQVVPVQYLGEVSEIIMGTALTTAPTAGQAHIKLFNRADRAIIGANLDGLLVYGSLIYKEYSHVPYDVFVTEHLKVVRTLAAVEGIPCTYEDYERHMRRRVLSVGLYAGSFNPLHVGHKDIIAQAQTTFDKIVVAQGINPEKGQPAFLSPILGVECIQYTTSLDDLYNKLQGHPNYNVTIVRGLRGADDVTAEARQRQFVWDLSGQCVPHVYYMCHPDVRHVSSTAVRNLIKMGKDVSAYV